MLGQPTRIRNDDEGYEGSGEEIIIKRTSNRRSRQRGKNIELLIDAKEEDNPTITTNNDNDSPNTNTVVIPINYYW